MTAETQFQVRITKVAAVKVSPSRILICSFLCLYATRYLTHTELSPLRAPLIPMEHCTTRFFEQCDSDNDKYIALEEWAACFGIKERKYRLFAPR